MQPTAKQISNHLDQTDNLDLAHEAIRKGERARIIFEILLSEIGASFENTRNEIWDKLKETQDDYEEAITILGQVMIANSQKKTQPKEGVSDSNY